MLCIFLLLFHYNKYIRKYPHNPGSTMRCYRLLIAAVNELLLMSGFTCSIVITDKSYISQITFQYYIKKLHNFVHDSQTVVHSYCEQHFFTYITTNNYSVSNRCSGQMQWSAFLSALYLNYPTAFKANQNVIMVNIVLQINSTNVYHCHFYTQHICALYIYV